MATTPSGKIDNMNENYGFGFSINYRGWENRSGLRRMDNLHDYQCFMQTELYQLVFVWLVRSGQKHDWTGWQLVTGNTRQIGNETCKKVTSSNHSRALHGCMAIENLFMFSKQTNPFLCCIHIQLDSLWTKTTTKKSNLNFQNYFCTRSQYTQILYQFFLVNV